MDLVYAIIPTYLRLLPNIDPGIFQALIQVIATLLGFSIVAVFYYLGKIDDLKTSYVNSLFGARKSVEDVLSIHEKFMKSVKDVLDADNEKKIPEHVKVTILKMYTEVKNSNKTQFEKLLIPIPEAIKTFEDIILLQSMSFSLLSPVSSAKILLPKVYLVPLILQVSTIRLPRIMKMVAAVVRGTVRQRDS
jgi:predicted transcriptional regulator